MFQSTPPRGRRRNVKAFFKWFWLVSIHASTREATWCRARNALRRGWFQSTPPRGRRHALKHYTGHKGVSIHASTREATKAIALRSRVAIVSIHASTREATGPFRSFMASPPCFNPRLHAGGDFLLVHGVLYYRVSIHASTREATGSWMGAGRCYSLFQSTPPRGRRLASPSPIPAQA
ncbi:MAG TPA: hypothetical protein GXX60_03800 [Anaerolineaceae bacterium]|nr:hypothetical protein [Anaerolineaceae bacterium]